MTTTAARGGLALCLVGLVLPATLAACSGGDDEAASGTRAPAGSPATPASQEPQIGPGIFSVTTDSGARIEFVIPADPSTPDMEDLERYRNAVNAPEPTYAVMNVDNSAGSGPVLMLDVEAAVVDAAGQQSGFTHIAAPEGYFETYLFGELPGSVADEASSWYSGFYDTQRLQPGAQASAIMTGPMAVDLDSIARVFVTPEEYGDSVEANRTPE